MATLRLQHGVISTDEHVQETPDVWTSRMSEARFGDDIPHLEERDDGSQVFLIQGKPALGGSHNLAIVDAATSPKNTEPRRWEDVPKITYQPSERLKAMDIDGLDTNTFFPNVAGLTNQQFQKEGSEDFRLACIQAYNDWLIEEWVAASPRFIAQCITPMWDVELAVSEINRSIKRGHKAVIWHGAPEVLGLRHFDDTYWDPIYKTCSDLAIPLCLHLGAVPQLPPSPSLGAQTARAISGARGMSGHMQVVINLLLCGVLERFPDLKVSIVESGIGWIPYLLELCDDQHFYQRLWEDGAKVKPGDLFRRQVWSTFWFEHFGVKARKDVGLENILYSTDFPHVTSTWPNSKDVRNDIFQGVPPEERRRILVHNPIELYGLDVDASELE